MENLRQALSNLKILNWERFLLRLIVSAIGCLMVGLGLLWEGGLVILIATFGDHFIFRLKTILTKAIDAHQQKSVKDKHSLSRRQIELRPNSTFKQEHNDETV